MLTATPLMLLLVGNHRFCPLSPQIPLPPLVLKLVALFCSHGFSSWWRSCRKQRSRRRCAILPSYLLMVTILETDWWAVTSIYILASCSLHVYKTDRVLDRVLSEMDWQACCIQLTHSQAATCSFECCAMRWFSCWFHNVVLIADCSVLAPRDGPIKLDEGSDEDVVSA